MPFRSGRPVFERRLRCRVSQVEMLAVERDLEDERTGPAAKQNQDLKARTSRAIIAQYSADQRSTCPNDCVMPGAGSAVETDSSSYGEAQSSARSITLKRASDVRSCRARSNDSERGIQGAGSDAAHRAARSPAAAHGRALPGHRPLRRRGRRRQRRDRQPAERVDGSALDSSRARTASRRTKRASGRSTGATGGTCRGRAASACS